jgi:type VI secretion system protein ImpA
MSLVDINALLKEVTPEAPCGEDLEYDTAFDELQRAVQGKPEEYSGKKIIKAAEPPNWREVRKFATELLGRSKDLRIGINMVQALVNLEGFLGLADGLSLLRGLLERYWDNVYPKLDPDDNNDPAMRINILVTLVDRVAMLNVIRHTPLVNSRAIGRFSLHEAAIAKGGEDAKAKGKDQSVPDQAAIGAAFMDADINELQATADAITRCSGDLAAIDAILTEKVGASQAPDLGALAAMFKEAQSLMNEYLPQRVAGNTEGPRGDTGTQEQETAAVINRPVVSGEINSREDAVRMMDKISNYFERNEPSSPVPLLMQRAKRLVSMSFMDILADIAPEGLKQAKNIGGIEQK